MLEVESLMSSFLPPDLGGPPCLYISFCTPLLFDGDNTTVHLPATVAATAGRPPVKIYHLMRQGAVRLPSRQSSRSTVQARRCVQNRARN